jgi:4-amino-4-deoxychorismate lyase
VTAWINGRRGRVVDCRDRGLQYGDGLFETMHVRDGRIRLLDMHLERLLRGCARLSIAAPAEARLHAEIGRIAARRSRGILKLILTRGTGPRGYRPSGAERTCRLATLHPLPQHADAFAPARVRMCVTPLSCNAALAGLKTLNRLDSVLARAEWHDARIWEGLMCDVDGNIVCGTMSNLFLRRGARLLTPQLDRGGVAGVMRRWVIETARAAGLRVDEVRVTRELLLAAEEMFMTNAVVGVRPVAQLDEGRRRVARFGSYDSAQYFNSRLVHA